MSKHESRQQQLLAGQSSLARKVFASVPIQAYWTAHDIHGALTNSSAHLGAVRACLRDLKEHGLVREPVIGHFQRSATTIQSKSEKSMPNTAYKSVLTIKKAGVSALDTLAVLSAEVASYSEEVGQRLKGLALRIEEVALSVEAEREINAEAVDKLKQLQSIFKGL